MASRRSSGRRSASSAPKYAEEVSSDASDNDSGKEAEEKIDSPCSSSRTKTTAITAVEVQSASKKDISGSGRASKEKGSSKKKCKVPLPSDDEENAGIDVVIPSSVLGIGTAGGAARECTVLIQIDPEDSSTLDFHGASGAVGRFEADDEGIKMDLKGFQYTGIINPGPTAIVASMTKGGQLKVESITDEFVTLRKTQDVMAQLDAVVEGDMDHSYHVTEEDVNRGGKAGDGDDGDSSTQRGGKGGKAGKKKKRAAKKPTGAPVSKKRRTSGTKGKRK